jgi:acyl-CoA reductase-like NAD-dependent aldehyde dehydrogenase
VRSTPPLTYPTLSTNFVRREPIGVCAGIVPWNFPLVLGLWKIAPALAAGNSIMIKPDEHTPLSLIGLAKIALECGVPAGVFNIVTGDGPDVGARLASHPDVGKVAFTGSTGVGCEIMRLASGTVKKVSLELGGKGPAVVLDDADLDAAVELPSSGRGCSAGRCASRAAELVERRDRVSRTPPEALRGHRSDGRTAGTISPSRPERLCPMSDPPVEGESCAGCCAIESRPVKIPRP